MFTFLKMYHSKRHVDINCPQDTLSVFIHSPSFLPLSGTILGYFMSVFSCTVVAASVSWVNSKCWCFMVIWFWGRARGTWGQVWWVRWIRTHEVFIGLLFSSMNLCTRIHWIVDHSANDTKEHFRAAPDSAKMIASVCSKQEGIFWGRLTAMHHLL